MRVAAEYDYPIQANRLDCPAGVVECISFVVDSKAIYNYQGLGTYQYFSTYFFSNMDQQTNVFALGVSYDGNFESSANVIKAATLIVATLTSFALMI